MAANNASPTVSSVLLIDSNHLRRAGIASLLSGWTKLNEIAIKQVSPHDVLREFEAGRRWHLVLLSVGGDTVCSGEFGTLVRVLPALAGDAPTVVMSDREEPNEVIVAYRTNCRGFVPTSMDPALAIQALTFILSGGSFFPPSALRVIELPGDNPEGDDGPPGGKFRQELTLQLNPEPLKTQGAARPRTKGQRSGNNGEPESDDANGLTHRQQEVLDHLRKGQPNKLIARALGLTEGTVKVHVRQIMRKFGAANRTEVAVLCVRVRRTASQTVPTELRVVEGFNGLPRSAA